MFLSKIHLTKSFFLNFYDCVFRPTCQKTTYCVEISPYRCAIVVGDGGEGEGKGGASIGQYAKYVLFLQS